MTATFTVSASGGHFKPRRSKRSPRAAIKATHGQIQDLDGRSAPMVDPLLPCHSLRALHLHVLFFKSGFACNAVTRKLLASACPSLDVFLAWVRDLSWPDAHFHLIV
ncbi:hypothetical protein BOTBODRAFT_39419 [Botryobasidium botryosum FD-172 SS1]|uniref:Uncharacterized protein n=1 Tax=Botryobasidium botryosum (strain FD-172 SS1) TaxID=930990 RepID=A0A067LUA5_BOTB1|nr:hypothetical protein BOTBODRAFT_39419 [Botryobasidium botryosum FD-172 SS1]